MALTFWKKLQPKPIVIEVPHKHTNNYGWYVSNKFYAPDGFYFNRQQNDASGRPAWGAYGHCTEDGIEKKLIKSINSDRCCMGLENSTIY